jgi:bifunctional non-homologous end joining protein LigD
MPLSEYNRKRNFKRTPEPSDSSVPSPLTLHIDSGNAKKNVKAILEAKQLHFVVQKHHASHLHYDFRLELDGVLKSWAVPKGPSLDPNVKRLAMMVEDHPISYMTFEGKIPEGNYGAGDVIVWDIGLYHSTERVDPEQNRKLLKKGLMKGHIDFVLYGSKIKGLFSLIKIRGNKNAWLLIKQKDEFASKKDPTEDDSSVISTRRLATKTRKSHSNTRNDSDAELELLNDTSVHESAVRQKTDPMPHDISPMLATLTDKPFNKPGWVFEIKWDGYRAIAEVAQSNKGTVKRKIRLYSRKGNSFEKKYPEIVEALKSFGHDVVLDGEIIALKEGMPDFHSLQNHDETHAPLQYIIFDLLYADGRDLRNEPLTLRKKILKEIIPKHKFFLESEHFEESGIKFFEEVKKKGFEGMVAKDGTSSYIEGKRAHSWLKVKYFNEQEAIIIGYTEPRGSRKNLGALVLGAYDKGKLRYIGHSGGGFTSKELKDVCKLLSARETARSPIREKVPVNSPITWVDPRYVCQIKFSEWTPDGRMRHPIYAGLREDKDPKEVTIEKPEIPSEQVTAKDSQEITLLNHAVEKSHFTNEDKIFWPKEGYTKGDIIAYYEKMADTILPYLKDRPESLHRHPNGIDGKSFFQKDIKMKVPQYIETHEIWSKSNEADIQYLLCQNKETLLYLANLGCIELNPWNSRIEALDKPDYMIIDLDPGDNTFDELVEVAQVVHEVLEESCEESFVKTSGKTGLHVLVPLGAQYDYETIRNFSHLLVQIVHNRIPKLTSIERSPAKRKNKIYLDYLQNRRGQTIAAPYSLRPAPGATVSTPLEWKEVKKGLDPRKFTIKTIWKRLEKKGDLWKSLPRHKVDLAEAIKCLEKKGLK